MQLQTNTVLLLVCLCVSVHQTQSTYEPRPDAGYSAGLIPECPGVMKNASIKAESLSLLRIVLHSLTQNGDVVRKVMPLSVAHKTIAKNKSIDFTKKTIVYACGFLDSSIYPHTQAIANTYSKRGYNVLVTETLAFYTYIYPKSARLTKVIGKMLGELLVKLYEKGLDPGKLELIGISLGAHTVSYASKHFYAVTKKKPSRLTGLDPAGPCFRSLPPEQRLHISDAERVDVLHTNIDGFGMAEKLGHVDFYANGGEYQPGDITYLPCLVICSHIRSILYWWISIDHPKKFMAMQCESIQDARLARCYGSSVINYLGPATNFTRPGLYYLPTDHKFPYYRGKDGLDVRNEIYTSVTRDINSDDLFEA